MQCELCKTPHNALTACDYCDAFACRQCRTGRACKLCLRAKAVTLTARAERLRQGPPVRDQDQLDEEWRRLIWG